MLMRPALLTGAIPTPDVLFDFLQNYTAGVLDNRLTFARAATTAGGAATDSVYTDAAGSSFNTFGTNVPRLTSRGLLREVSRTNLLLNSAAPVTQTTGSLGAANYTLWIVGTGSATSSAGTAVGTGFGVATAGVPNVVTITNAGTVIVTLAGSVDRFQLEAGSSPSSFIQTVGATSNRPVDICYIAMPTPYLFTMAATAIGMTSPVTVNNTIFALATSNGVTRAAIRLAAGVSYPEFAVSGGGATSLGDGGVMTAGVPYRMAAAMAGHNATQALNGGPLRTGNIDVANTLIPGSLTHLFAGGISTAGGTQDIGYLQRAALWRQVLSSSQIQGVSR